ncbi:MAG: beta-hydroxyacyl-ACP dehydratase [Planctomycetia bacterium]|nr:beta-hydroxyacyl-ACP dehydratase [Planctomycetia bacterium]
MNWYWIDRFTVFESGKRAQAIKTISRSEDHLRDHFKFHSVMPLSLMIEGVAQTAGLLIHETHNLEKKVVLGKIPKIEIFDTEITPGDVLVYDAVIEYIRDEGSMAAVTIHRDGKLLGEGVIVFAHLGADFTDKELFADGELEDLFRAYGIYDVGVQADGTPLADPAVLRQCSSKC